MENCLKITCKVLYTLVVGTICFAIGIEIARYQANKHNPFNVHWKMEQNGYNYCPYCGENIGLTVTTTEVTYYNGQKVVGDDVRDYKE